MSPEADIVDRDQQMLAELAELDLALARHVQARALATDDPAEVADLSRAYQRIARSVRQTLALKAKLKRDAQQHARWLEARDGRPVARPVDPATRRREQLESAVARVIWAEREFEIEAPDAQERLDRRFENLDRILHHRSLTGRLDKGTLDEAVLDLCGELGLARLNALRWRDLPEPEFGDEDEDDPEDVPEPRRSSA